MAKQPIETGNKAEDPAKRPAPTVAEIVEAIPDPFLLLEAVHALAQTDRFRRNNSLFQVTSHYAVEQKSMREWQARLDARAEQKTARVVSE